LTIGLPAAGTGTGSAAPAALSSLRDWYDIFRWVVVVSMFSLIGIYTEIHGDSNLICTLRMREMRRDLAHTFTMGEVSSPLNLIADVIRDERNRIRNRSPEWPWVLYSQLPSRCCNFYEHADSPEDLDLILLGSWNQSEAASVCMYAWRN
jgi:hypothetical protein